MDDTRISLLQRAGQGSHRAWRRIDELYRPFLYGLLRRHSFVHDDAEDLVQEVLSYVAQQLSEFAHAGRPGAFRSWLRAIALNRIRDFRRKQGKRPSKSTEWDAAEPLGDDELTREWDMEHDRFVVVRLLELMEAHFEANTLLAFRRLVIDEVPAQRVASELGMSIGAVYVARSRVMRRLRVDAQGLVDDSF